jgi:hypothetical protein
VVTNHLFSGTKNLALLLVDRLHHECRIGGVRMLGFLQQKTRENFD